MAKKTLKLGLKVKDEIIENTVLGIVNNNSIKYNDDGVIVVININDNIINMKRETDEYQLILNFIKDKESKGSYLLKEVNSMLDINIKTNYLEIIDNSIKIVYELNDEVREFSLLIRE